MPFLHVGGGRGHGVNALGVSPTDVFTGYQNGNIAECSCFPVADQGTATTTNNSWDQNIESSTKIKSFKSVDRTTVTCSLIYTIFFNCRFFNYG